MPLAELQEALAAIYLSSQERQVWLDQPAEILHRYRLQDAEARMLHSIAPERLARYSAELRQKRFEEIGKLLPLTWSSSAIAALREAFDVYAEQRLPRGAKKHIADVMAFGKMLLDAPERLSARAEDLLRFELVPWRMHFDLEEISYMLQGSRRTVCLIEAHRVHGMRGTIDRFHQYMPRTLRQLQDVQMCTQDMSSRIRGLGICVKLPLMSAWFEWHVPYWK